MHYFQKLYIFISNLVQRNFSDFTFLFRAAYPHISYTKNRAAESNAAAPSIVFTFQLRTYCPAYQASPSVKYKVG